MKKLSFITISAVLLALAGPSPVAIAAGKVTATAKPILLPDRLSPEDCNKSVVFLTKSDKSKFIVGDKVVVQSSIEEGPIGPNLAPQNPGEAGVAQIRYAAASNSGPTSVAVAVQLCAIELPEIDPTYLWVYLDLQSSTGTSKAQVKVKMPILKRTPSLIAADSMIDTCKIDSKDPTFGTNIIFKATAKGVRDYYTEGVMGMQLTLQGTLTRRGIVSREDSIYFIIPGEKIKKLATAKTNSKGEFKVTFVAPRLNYGDSTSVSMTVASRVIQIEGLSVSLPATSEGIHFDWFLEPSISSIGGSNWIPTFNEACISAYDAYDEQNDDKSKSRAVLISTALGLLGTENKSQSEKSIKNSGSMRGSSTIYMTSPSSKKIYKRSLSGSGPDDWDGYGSIGGGSGSSLDGGSSGSIGGRCYVKGHYRSGKWVSGYYRRC